MYILVRHKTFEADACFLQDSGVSQVYLIEDGQRESGHMNKSRITYRFDQDKEQFHRSSSAFGNSSADDQRTSTGRFERSDAAGFDSEGSMNAASSNEAKNRLLDSQMLNQYTTDYGAWSSPFDIETERLERLIRESSYPEDVPEHDGRDRLARADSHNRVGQRADSRNGRRRDEEELDNRDLASELFDRDDRANDRENGPIIEDQLLAMDAAASYRSGGYSWFRVAVTIFGAIATGVMFGLFIMQLFTNLTLNSEVPIQSGRQAQTDAPPVSRPGIDITAPDVDAEAQATSVSLPQNTVYMLQFGVFSSAEGARAAIDQLQLAGIASAYEAGDRHVVYAGLTPDRNSALLLSNQLAGMKLETYVKPYERPDVQSLRWGEADAARIESYFNAGADLARTVSLLTLVHLDEKELTNFEDATIQALASSHQRWKMLAGELAKDVPERAQEVYLQMNNSLTSAVESLVEYKKNPTVSYLWQAQSAVMDYVILEHSLLRDLAA